MTKVKLPREVAQAIEDLRKDGMSNFNIMYQAQGAVVTNSYLTIRKWAFDFPGEGSPDLLMQALVNGYEVEKTPEDRVREYFEILKRREVYAEENGHLTAQHRQGRLSVAITLDILGIKIKGVNAE